MDSRTSFEKFADDFLVDPVTTFINSKLYNCCYNCANAILGDDSTWDCPATFYGCMIDKNRKTEGKGLDCFDSRRPTPEMKRQKKIMATKMAEERIRQKELAELARLKAKYEA